jgi:ABC-2 type transport system ATP-binding protein
MGRHVTVTLPAPPGGPPGQVALRFVGSPADTGAMPVIETRALTRRFPHGTALDRLTLDVEAGEVLALLGPNGAGKTTTVRLLNGILAPDGGRARVLGLDPAVSGDEVRRRTGVLTENAGLDDRLTTRENLEWTARLRGLDAAGARRRTAEVLERFGLADRADDLTQGFSTGQRKRVALARALLHDPQVLFLDEPTSGLDPAGTRDVIELIGRLSAEGRTIVLATHFLGEAGRLADRMAVLHQGRLRALGKPAELAADLWASVPAEIDTGRPLVADELAALGTVPGVLHVEPRDAGARVHGRDRAVVPAAVAALVARAIPVYGVSTAAPTLEDVYFEIEARIRDEDRDGDGAVSTDGFLGTPTPSEQLR